MKLSAVLATVASTTPFLLLAGAGVAMLVAKSPEPPPPAACEPVVVEHVVPVEVAPPTTVAVTAAPATPAHAPDDALACADPLVGTWIAHTHTPETEDHYGSWNEYTLSIDRGLDGKLSSSLEYAMWDANTVDSPVPHCADGSLQMTHVHIDAKIDAPANGAVRIDTVRYRETQNCEHRGAYAADHFTGHLDPATGVLDTVNNDGKYAFDRPYVYHRVSCVPQTPATR